MPANPKFYDIVHAFDKNDEILLKQSSDVRVGDGVFIYVAAPVSAVLYGCEAVEVNLPYDYRENGLNITKVMRLKLIKRYATNEFSYEILKNKFKIKALRGPIGVGASLAKALRKRDKI